MNKVKIIVCSTFRDFSGTENDKIQNLFLINNQAILTLQDHY